VKRFKAEFRALGSIAAICEQRPGPYLVVRPPRDDPPTAPSGPETKRLDIAELQRRQGQAKAAEAVFDLKNHSVVRIGRATIAQIRLPLETISNLHASLVRTPGGWKIYDHGAKNGVFVCGAQVQGEESLPSGAALHFGDVEAVFFDVQGFLAWLDIADLLTP
jgi:pSer/pThr/pTyr-binding forkhead associated (FHA) protein